MLFSDIERGISCAWGWTCHSNAHVYAQWMWNGLVLPHFATFCHNSNALCYGRCYLVTLNVESHVLGAEHGNSNAHAYAFSDSECEMGSSCHNRNALYYGRYYLVILNVGLNMACACHPLWHNWSCTGSIILWHYMFNYLGKGEYLGVSL